MRRKKDMNFKKKSWIELNHDSDQKQSLILIILFITVTFLDFIILSVKCYQISIENFWIKVIETVSGTPPTNPTPTATSQPPIEPTTPKSGEYLDWRWQCDNGQCISRYWFCDGEPDCKDVSDEGKVCGTGCNYRQWQCDNGQCIPKNWFNDGMCDWKDGSDEERRCK